MYELWDNDTRSAIDEYVTEAEALAEVRDVLATHGRNAVISWALLKDDGVHPVQRVAVGAELIAFALRAAPAPPLHAVSD